jgi:malate synthase
MRLLPPALLALLASLHRELEPERRELLAERRHRQAEWDRGGHPDYVPAHEGYEARLPYWRVPPLPADLVRRRVGIVVPADDAGAVAAMLAPADDGARADVALFDFEDSLMPAWPNLLRGQELFAAAAAAPRAGAPLPMLRCRGLHLDECNLWVAGAPLAGALLDLAVATFHGARPLLQQGRTCACYLPKIEHYREARWWHRLLGRLEQRLGLPHATLRPTVLIETLPAAFQMEEILFELRDRAAGLELGRQDMVFSDIKALAHHDDRVFADRAWLLAGPTGLERPWLRDCALRLIKICHRRGAAAIGAAVSLTPATDAQDLAAQQASVAAAARLECSLGHDGCWVTDPCFIGAALAAFPRDHQGDVIPAVDDYPDLLPRGEGPRTLAGLHDNARAGIAYLHGWQRQRGRVALDGACADLATLEAARVQTWQWLRHRVALDDGQRVTRELVTRVFAEELRHLGGDGEEWDVYARAAAEAAAVFTETDRRPFFVEASELAPPSGASDSATTGR